MKYIIMKSTVVNIENKDIVMREFGDVWKLSAEGAIFQILDGNDVQVSFTLCEGTKAACERMFAIVVGAIKRDEPFLDIREL